MVGNEDRPHGQHVPQDHAQVEQEVADRCCVVSYRVCHDHADSCLSAREREGEREQGWGVDETQTSRSAIC